jgi:hypothetical protein
MVMEAQRLEHLDSLLAKGPQIGQAAAWGALLGGVYGFFLVRGAPPGGGRIVSTGSHTWRLLGEGEAAAKYAALGALGFAAFAALSYKLGQGVSRSEHARLGPPAPPSPVVTRGAFAGLPRPLFNTEDGEE